MNSESLKLLLLQLQPRPKSALTAISEKLIGLNGSEISSLEVNAV